MTETLERVRAQYDGQGLVDRIEAALSAIASEDQPLTVAQLATLDQFHTRGLFATADLARAAGVKASDIVLDLGGGIGGPARYLASMFGCTVTGVDISPSFVEAAAYLTKRCGLQDRVSFKVGDALHTPCEDGAFDVVFLQHVAMNIADRAALYAEVRRILKPCGRIATYDVVGLGDAPHYPVPWARTPDTSFLLDAQQTRLTVEAAGFQTRAWQDDTETAVAWFENVRAAGPPAGLNLGVVTGPEFPGITDNLARSLMEGRIGILLAVFEAS